MNKNDEHENNENENHDNENYENERFVDDSYVSSTCSSIRGLLTFVPRDDYISTTSLDIPRATSGNPDRRAPGSVDQGPVHHD